MLPEPCVLLLTGTRQPTNRILAGDREVLVCPVFLLFFAVLFMSIQESSFAQAMEGEYAVKVDVESVFLNLSVRECNTNRSLAGLQKNDFPVYEDGVRQDIQQFLPTEAPFNLLLLLDVSKSTSSYLGFMRQAAIEFTHRISPDDRIAIATFNSKVRLIQGFTNSRSEAEHAGCENSSFIGNGGRPQAKTQGYHSQLITFPCISNYRSVQE